MKKISIDTNAYNQIVFQNKRALDIINSADQVYIPFIVQAELFAGFKNGNRAEQNLEIFNKVAAAIQSRIIHSTSETVAIYSDLFKILRGKGKTIPSNDLWIAALCIENSCLLYTLDSHFSNVPGLRIIS